MNIEDLDLKTRNKIYFYTIKVLRKYQKAIFSGKITADKFFINLVDDSDILNIVDKDILNNNIFKCSYINYINILIEDQKNIVINKKKPIYHKNINSVYLNKSIKLKNILKQNGYQLKIPFKYLNIEDINIITEYILTGKIKLGKEKYYNYVSNS